MDYLLSIAIPTFNGSKTIKNMMDLLLKQYDTRVEIIVSDNCSTDNTKLIIEEYQKKYPIRYVRNEKNIGPDANFLQCMRLAKGKFTYLLSDDDVLVDGALAKILQYLEKYPKVSLVYLDSVGFKDEYKGLDFCHPYTEHVREIDKDIYTNDRVVFMNYAIRMWGFMSSFLWATESFNNIDNPEQYNGTYWLQSYIHINCVKHKEDYLGVIKGPCVAAGEYRGINNFSAAEVDGIYYRKMLECACETAYFDANQLKKFYVWRICLLGKIAVIKEREAGIHRTDKKELFNVTKKYPYAWFHLYPYFFVPKFVIKFRQRLLHRAGNANVKRNLDV